MSSCPLMAWHYCNNDTFQPLYQHQVLDGDVLIYCPISLSVIIIIGLYSFFYHIINSKTITCHYWTLWITEVEIYQNTKYLHPNSGTAFENVICCWWPFMFRPHCIKLIICRPSHWSLSNCIKLNGPIVWSTMPGLQESSRLITHLNCIQTILTMYWMVFVQGLLLWRYYSDLISEIKKVILTYCDLLET